MGGMYLRVEGWGFGFAGRGGGGWLLETGFGVVVVLEDLGWRFRYWDL